MSMELWRMLVPGMAPTAPEVLLIFPWVKDKLVWTGHTVQRAEPPGSPDWPSSC